MMSVNNRKMRTENKCSKNIILKKRKYVKQRNENILSRYSMENVLSR